MKYRCKICGYIYDDAIEKTNFVDLPSDWRCPVCKASKNDFELVDESALKPVDNNKYTNEHEEELQPLTKAEFARICSNLARGLDKQYMFKERDQFQILADYFSNKTELVNEPTIDMITELLLNDLNNLFPQVTEVAKTYQDRGALRAKTWSEKVSLNLRNILDQLALSTLEITNIWVCTICGYIYIGVTQPELCPVCKVPGWKFTKVEDK